MPGKRIGIFATKNDLESGLKRFEDVRNVKYILRGLFDTQELHEFQTFGEIPNLGISESGSETLAPNYMIMDTDSNINVREVPQRRGGIKYAIDQLENKESLNFKPSGIYENNFLISGEFSPGISEKAIELYEQFRKTFLKGFVVVKSYRVGPEALKLLDEGIPLTRNYKAQSSMYLKR